MKENPVDIVAEIRAAKDLSEAVDCVVRHFAADTGTLHIQEIVDAAFRDAVAIAEKVAPYRHARLSAMKLAGDPNNSMRIKDDATVEEIRAELMKHMMILIDGGLIDLEALPVPNRGIANQPNG
jgi:hypothetical protein